MSVTFHWILGIVDSSAAPAMRRRFRETEATAATRVPENVDRVMRQWRADPGALNPADPSASEAFNRAFHLPLEPFVHDIVFRGLDPAWQPREDNLVLVMADRVPPTASLAVALGPTCVASLPGDCLQFFVEATEIDEFALTAHAIAELDAQESLIERACSWLALHNSLRFSEGSYSGAEAARRLLAVLPKMAARAASEHRALFSACAVGL